MSLGFGLARPLALVASALVGGAVLAGPVAAAPLGQLPAYTVDSQSLSARQSLGVNVAGGNLLLASKDLSVSSTGVSMGVQRFYNSGDTGSGQLGTDGRLGFAKDVTLAKVNAAGDRELVGPSGYRATFARSGSAFTTPPLVGNVTLRQTTGGRFELTDNKSGVVWGFPDVDASYMDLVRDTHGNQMSFAFGGTGGALSQITDSQGRQYAVTSSGGRITRIAAPSTLISGGIEWNYNYDGSGNLTSVQDPEGHTTTYTYSGGLLGKVVDARATSTRIAYDGAQRVASVTTEIDGTTANEVKTTYAYSVDSATCGASAAGKTVATDPRGKVTTYCWTADGRVTKAIDALGRPTSTMYTSSGNVENFTEFAGTGSGVANTALTYSTDGNDNLMGATAPAGEATSFTYDSGSSDPLAAYRVKQVTDPQGKTTNYGYNAANDVTSIKDSAGLPVNQATLAYNADGTLKASTDGNGNTTSYFYDGDGNLTEVRPASTAIGSTFYTYDGISRTKTKTDGRGKVTTYTFNKLGEAKVITDDAGATTTFSYDPDGNLTQRGGTSGTSTYGYDKLNRRTSESFPGSVNNTYGYDKTGNLTSLTDPSGVVMYGYDDLGRTVSVVSPKPTGGTATTSYSYQDPSSGAPTASVTQTLHGGGVVKKTQDLSGKLGQVLVKTSGGTQTLKRDFEYTTTATGSQQHELLDKLTSQAGSGAPVTSKVYGYTQSNQLASAQTLDGAGTQTARDTFTYDGASNRKTRVRETGAASATTTYAYNAVNEMCWRKEDVVTSPACGSVPTGATQFTYDADGNQTAGDGSFTYDALGRLSALNGNAITNLAPSNFDVTAQGSSSYQNNQLGVGRITVAGNLTTMVRLPDDGSVATQVRDNTFAYLIQDNIGSTIATADPAGNVTRVYDYDTDGNTTTSGSAPEPWVRFAGGQYLTTGGGTYHFGARYYQASTGRWTQQDPLLQPGDLGQANRYAYVGNDGVNFKDPTGEFRIPIPRPRLFNNPSPPKKGAVGLSGRPREGCIVIAGGVGSRGGILGAIVGGLAGVYVC